MNKSDSIKNLAKALSQVQAEIEPAAFDTSNKFLGNKYASLGAVIEAARPVLPKYSLSYSQVVESNDAGFGVTTILMHESGEWIEGSVFLPVGDERGKSMAQVGGSIITYLRRYSLAAIIGIYADEDDDGESQPRQQRAVQKQTPPARPHDPETVKADVDRKATVYQGRGDELVGELAGEKPMQPTNGNGKAKTARPYAPEIVKAGIDEKANKKHQGKAASDYQRRNVVIALEKCFAGDPNHEEKRHAVQAYLTGEGSSKNIPDNYVLALFDWLKPYQDDGGEYTCDPMAAKEAQSIYTAHLEAQGQQALI
jgi:hypothetical protein